ncbi:type IV pilus secretin PilQ, partial [bacterium]
MPRPPPRGPWPVRRAARSRASTSVAATTAPAKSTTMLLPCWRRLIGVRGSERRTTTRPAPSLPRRKSRLEIERPAAPAMGREGADGASETEAAAGEFEQLAYQSDDQYVIEVQPQRAARAVVDEKPVYTGERINMTFQSLDTRAALQLLADASGQNIVVNDTVTGSLTLRLQNVPWDQALDIVLRTKGLDKRRTDNVIIVAPADEIAAREKAELA